MAGILRTLEKHQEAVEAAQRAVALCPSFSYRPRLADTLAKAGRFDESERTYEEMLRDHPDRAYYWFYYATFLLEHRTGRVEEAREAFDQAQIPDTEWSVPASELDALRTRLDPAEPTPKR